MTFKSKRRKKPQDKHISEREKAFNKEKSNKDLTYNIGETFNQVEGYTTYRELKEDMERR